METTTILSIIIGVLILVFLAVIINKNTKHETVVADLESKVQVLAKIKSNLQNIVSDLRLDNANAIKIAERYEKIHYKKESELLELLRFRMPNGEVANNVKVKTIKNKEGDIIGVRATIRRYVNGKSSEVAVKPFLVS